MGDGQEGGVMMREVSELVRRLTPPKRTPSYAYRMGYNCAVQGASKESGVDCLA